MMTLGISLTRSQPDLVVVGPEQPLVDGIVDKFKQIGVPCFGPSQAAAQLEGSKAFSKDFMKRHDIPTAAYKTVSSVEDGEAYINSVDHQVVIKASGLAAGKGVLLPSTKKEALDGLRSMISGKEFGSAGDQVVIEELLEGQECSILAFTDGHTVVSFPAAQDHKRAFDGDKGPNTGGMGAYAPAPVVTSKIAKIIHETILQTTVDGMRRDGVPFVGILYAGVMLTKDGPKVLEYNCRFGDPETQVLLPLLSDKTDLVEVMLACCNGHLDSLKIEFKQGFAATVVAASHGYPGTYIKGVEIEINAEMSDSEHIFHAGTSLSATQNLQTNGGRVLAVTAVDAALDGALKKCYHIMDNGVKFDKMHFRRDIGHHALTYLKDKKSDKLTYADAGVSIDAGNLLVEQIKSVVKSTRRAGADADIGGFGGVFDLKAAGYGGDALLVSATDGVGTKLKIAQIVGKHDTIGIDLVAMNVNDLVVQAAEPLFFLDYFACGKLDVSVTRDVVVGVAEGCKQANCALIGGETAEMPGLYSNGDYDLAGFTVGAVERHHVLPRMDDIKPGDFVLGIPSSGVHSNGFSLVRHVVEKSGLSYHDKCPFYENCTLGEALLTPTRIYVRTLLPAVRSGAVKALAHITGGGFPENIPRVIPKYLGIKLDGRQWPLLPVFKWLKKTGNISTPELCRTFNCGLGMIMVVGEKDVERAINLLKSSGETVYTIGKVQEWTKGVEQIQVEHTEHWDQ